MNTTIRKLPGSKKQFPLVKPVIDCRRPARVKPDNVSNKPSKAEQDVARSSAIQTRPSWNSSTRIAATPDLYIKPLPGTKKQLDQLKDKSFQARPVPSSHMEPYRPVLLNQKVRQFIGKKKLAEKCHAKPAEKVNDSSEKSVIETPEAEMRTGIDDSGLISRMLHSVLGPVLYPKKRDEKVVAKETKTEENEVVDESKQVVPVPEGAVGTEDPGLISRAWHSVVDPILHSKKQETEGIEKFDLNELHFEVPITIRLHEDSLVVENYSKPSAMVAESKNPAVDGPTGFEEEVRKHPKGYGSKKERIRRAMEKKGRPCDEMPPKQPFKNQTRKRAKSPSLYEIYENLMSMPAYKESD